MIPNTLDHLGHLISFDTTNPPRAISSDSPIIQYLHNKLDSLGFSVEVIDYGDGRVNVYALRGSPRILFNVHIDTVPTSEGWTHNPFEMKLIDDRIYGLGACDIKGAAACLLDLAEAMVDYPLALLFSTDEEGANGCCVAKFCASNLFSGFEQVVVAEPTQCEAVLAHRGYLSMLGEFSGVAGHSSEARALSDNAIHKACAWAAEALVLAKSEQDIEHGGYAGLCFNLGTIKGGIKSNVIADSAEIKWSARLRPMDDVDEWCHRFQSLGNQKDVQWHSPFNGPPLPADLEQLKAAERFAKQHNIPIANGVNFWTEASLFSAVGVPALVLGSGNIAQAHCADEWVSLSQLETIRARYQRIIEGAANV